MSRNPDNIVFGIEKKFGVQAIESEGRGLWYLQDDEKRRIGILTIENGIPKWSILSREQFKVLAHIISSLKSGQLKALVKEANDIYDVVFN